VSIHLTEKIPCPDCLGSGNSPDAPWLQCGWCLGTGTVYVNVPATPPDLAPLQYEDDPPGRDVTTCHEDD